VLCDPSTVLTELPSATPSDPVRRRYETAKDIPWHRAGSRTRFGPQGVRAPWQGTSACLFAEHDLFRKPVPTFRDHAL